ncbi:MAG: GTP-binding protein [Nitrospinota bacterium]|nr:GTP-binding protein [Nitrospinota bacterium]
MHEELFPLVIVGHVDHGKSTLIGRLLLDTGSLPRSVMNNLDAFADNSSMKLAHIMDHFKEERERGITIDTSQKFFNTSKRRYIIIDAPGHREFIKNMISGASHADGAMILLDANEGIMDQTKRHAYLLSLIGIKQVAVLVNKMDLVKWSESAFNSIVKEMTELLSSFRIQPKFFIPISAMLGDNIAKKTENANWYTGPCVLEALDQFKAKVMEELDLRFSIQDSYDFLGEIPVYPGRVESGTLRTDTEYFLQPGNEKVTVRTIEKFGHKNVSCAITGESVAVTIDCKTGADRGKVIVDGSSIKFGKMLHTHLFWMSSKPGNKNEKYVFKCLTQDIGCKIKSITKVFDPGNNIPDVLDVGEEITESHIADVIISLDDTAVYDPFISIPSMGRFVLEINDIPVAAGTIY